MILMDADSSIPSTRYMTRGQSQDKSEAQRSFYGHVAPGRSPMFLFILNSFPLYYVFQTSFSSC
jgi:hypothetical protein